MYLFFGLNGMMRRSDLTARRRNGAWMRETKGLPYGIFLHCASPEVGRGCGRFVKRPYRRARMDEGSRQVQQKGDLLIRLVACDDRNRFPTGEGYAHSTLHLPI